MYSNREIKLIAIAIIIQAINDLNIKRKKEKYYKRTAHTFFQSEYRFVIASLAGIEDIDFIYKKYNNNGYKKIKRSGIRKERINEPIYIL